jgi:hydroxymethylpyrimidine/phosphomethylpyrimidine kinase
MIDMKDIKRVLSIAGSDSGGGAGIQADLKTFAALGVYGMTAITAITAQNTLGVTSIHGVDPIVIGDQIDAVIQDIGVDAVKIGMLHSSEVIEIVAERVRRYDLRPILDPVMVSTSGSQLLKPEAKEAVVKQLLSQTMVLTPNRYEAEILSGIDIEDIETAQKAARKIGEMGPEAVMVKGGHLDSKEKAIDILYTGDGFTILEGQYHATHGTHGTGCTLSSAIAAYIAKGYPIPEAAKKAKDFVNKAIKNYLDLGSGSGPVNAMANLYDEAEKVMALENIREAISIVESEPSIRELIAECQMNIGMALSYANGPMDVVAVDGRITKHMEGVRASGCPKLGASRHNAKTILAVKEYDPSKRAGLNLKYREGIIKICQDMGLKVSYYDRKEEPEEIKKREGMTTAWGAREAIKTVEGTPDVIYHMGDWGKEPMIVLLGESATQIAKMAVNISRRWTQE